LSGTHKYRAHLLRRTKAAFIHRKTGNIRAVQLLIGHAKVENTVRYLGNEVCDVLQIYQQVEWQEAGRNSRRGAD